MPARFEFKRNPDFLRKLERLSGPDDVPLPELLPPSFMARYTRFDDISTMIAASPVAALFDTDPKAAWHSEEWQAFVVATTDFGSFDAFLRTAATEHFKRGLND